MTENEQYLLHVAPRLRGGIERRSLWRVTAGRWEYQSLIDRQWHVVPDGRVGEPPLANQLVEITDLEARQLAADPRALVTFWAKYGTFADPSIARPRTVVRRRSSPELLLDEAYGRRGWGRTQSILEWEHAGSSQPPVLVPIDAEEADRTLFELRGVEGATLL